MSPDAANDPHFWNSVLAVRDDEGNLLLGCRRPHDLQRILADLEPFQS